MGCRAPAQRLRRLLPLRHGADDDDGLEEERRLFYVAVTRPRRNLHLYVPRRFHYRPVGDGHGFAKLSRFLSPAAQELIVRREPVVEAEEAAAAAGAGVVPKLDHLFG